MARPPTEDELGELRESIRLAAAEFDEINNRYDALLAEAHKLQHGSVEMIEALRQ
jgi:hypothetical protein